MQDKASKRPYGITAISVLLLTVGANMTGIAIFTLASDMNFLASEAGAIPRYLMFAYIFGGLLTAGFGIALYEGLLWARSAALFTLAFFATLKSFSLFSHDLGGRLTSAGLLAVCVAAIVYLSLPQAKGFLSIPLDKKWDPVPARAFQRAL